MLALLRQKLFSGYLLLFFFAFFTGIVCPPVFAATAEISGTIEEITSFGKEKFNLIVKTENGIEKFSIDRSTQVEMAVSAKDVQVGQEIVVSSSLGGISGTKGMKGMKSPFGNMGDSTRKMLGLPNIPAVPEIPSIPKIPKIPNALKIPNAPPQPLAKMAQIPMLPGQKMPMSSASQVQIAAEGAAKPQAAEGKQSPDGIAAAPTGDLLSQGAQQTMPAGIGQKQAKAPQPEGEKELAPKGPGEVSLEEFLRGETAKIKKTPVEDVEASEEKSRSENSPAKAELVSETKGGKVVNLKKTKEGIEIRMTGKKGEEKVLLSPDDRVQKMMSIKDLQKKMKVILKITGEPKEKMVKQIVIA